MLQNETHNIRVQALRMAEQLAERRTGIRQGMNVTVPTSAKKLIKDAAKIEDYILHGAE